MHEVVQRRVPLSRLQRTNALFQPDCLCLLRRPYTTPVISKTGKKVRFPSIIIAPFMLLSFIPSLMPGTFLFLNIMSSLAISDANSKCRTNSWFSTVVVEATAMPPTLPLALSSADGQNTPLHMHLFSGSPPLAVSTPHYRKSLRFIANQNNPLKIPYKSTKMLRRYSMADAKGSNETYETIDMPSITQNATPTTVSICPNTFSWILRTAKAYQDPFQSICGVLYGTVNQQSGHIYVEAVLELPMPTANASLSSTQLLSDKGLKSAQAVAHLLGLQIVGWVYTSASSRLLEHSLEKDRRILSRDKGKPISVDKLLISTTQTSFALPFGAREILQTCSLQAYCETLYANGSVAPMIAICIGIGHASGNITFEAFQVHPEGLRLHKEGVFADWFSQPSSLYSASSSGATSLRSRALRKHLLTKSALGLGDSLDQDVRCKKVLRFGNQLTKCIPPFIFTRNAALVTHKSWLSSRFPPISNMKSSNDKDHESKEFERRLYSLKTCFKTPLPMIDQLRDFHLLIFLSNFLSLETDLPNICAAASDLTNTIRLPRHYEVILKKLVEVI